ncbi:hypothetical protein BDF22DRAFT_90893 [Syncephalis plumigaleata]|nr:hypothetical protein BDF22DRAFT_90893 [Syncephalis plumigaleata]
MRISLPITPFWLFFSSHIPIFLHRFPVNSLAFHSIVVLSNSPVFAAIYTYDYHEYSCCTESSIMMVKIHQRIYSEEDLEAVDRAFEEACVTFQRELDAYLAATPRKPRNKKHRRAKSVTPSAGRRGRMRMTGKGNSSNSNNNNNNNDDNDDEDDEEHFRLMLNSSPTVTKRRRLLQMKNDADIDLMPIPSSPLVSPTNELESNYIPLLINEESTEDEDEDEDEDVRNTRLETNQTPESNASDVSNDQENVMPPSMEQSINSVPNKTSLDKSSFIKEELTFSNSADVVKLASNEYEPCKLIRRCICKYTR